jgi:hypothetical protein
MTDWLRRRLYFRLTHFTLPGGVFSQAMESVTPEAICAQAFSVAVRTACASVEAPAVRQAVRPLNVTQTSQRNLFMPMVVKISTARTAAANAMARTTVFFTS